MSLLFTTLISFAINKFPMLLFIRNRAGFLYWIVNCLSSLKKRKNLLQRMSFNKEYSSLAKNNKEACTEIIHHQRVNLPMTREILSGVLHGRDRHVVSVCCISA